MFRHQRNVHRMWSIYLDDIDITQDATIQPKAPPTTLIRLHCFYMKLEYIDAWQIPVNAIGWNPAI